MVALGEVVTLLETWFPPATAQSWDRIGLVSGDPGQEVTRVHLAVDPTQAVTPEMVARFFEPVWPAHAHPLRHLA